MKTLKNYFFLTIITLLSIHNANSQIYLGVSGGLGFIEHKNIEFFQQSYKVKGTTFAHKVTLGYQKSFIGIELGYRTLGNVSEQTSNYALNVVKKGWEASIRGKYSFGNISLFGKAGAIFLSNRNYYTLAYNQKNTFYRNHLSRGFLWGFGGEIALSKKLALRLEYESIAQKAEISYNAITIGSIFTLKSMDKNKGLNR
ncbi:outer membrane beta-barrel protein [Flammeovirga aprica]|uniref:Outer membrane beta-barrel protein n=1 Tax=Flammeovirga aprica JL-4 TaxID=694437 RepID=A0A7X9P231_9BACT|nr:outer membrane beta-barrel protein [Flammeovirga aprica]NME68111.1 outer membrane beta-barrel protein [Flammeovirga aprica JL-4]